MRRVNIGAEGEKGGRGRGSRETRKGRKRTEGTRGEKGTHKRYIYADTGSNQGGSSKLGYSGSHRERRAVVHAWEGEGRGEREVVRA